MTERSVQIPCPDGPILAGRLFLPSGAEARRAVVIHGATGVPRDYYARFARWLADGRQAAVLIYDYRDCGGSATGPINRATSTMGDWGIKDQGAALDWLCQEFPEMEVEVIGHSLGGMFTGFHDQAPRVSRVTAVASGPAHWTRHPASYIPRVIAFWFVLGPLLTRMMGYLPGRMLGMGADLPAQVYWQWRRWCVSRPFHRVDWGTSLPVPQLDRFRGRLRLVGIADDVMIPPPVVRDLAQFYPAAEVEHAVIDPAALGIEGIGHLRVFSERCKAAWPLLIAA